MSALIPYQYYQDYLIKQEEMGGACDTYGEERNAQKFLGRKFEGKSHLEGVVINGRIIAKQLLVKYGGCAWTGCVLLRGGACGGLL